MKQHRIENDDKKCWSCKSILVENGQLGLCPKCINKYGTPVAAVGLVALGLAGTHAFKNRTKIFNFLLNIAK
jgi:hypothetical protein